MTRAVKTAVLHVLVYVGLGIYVMPGMFASLFMGFVNVPVGLFIGYGVFAMAGYGLAHYSSGKARVVPYWVWGLLYGGPSLASWLPLQHPDFAIYAVANALLIIVVVIGGYRGRRAVGKEHTS